MSTNRPNLRAVRVANQVDNFRMADDPLEEQRFTSRGLWQQTFHSKRVHFCAMECERESRACRSALQEFECRWHSLKRCCLMPAVCYRTYEPGDHLLRS
jgi:hypothetical protein